MTQSIQFLGSGPFDLPAAQSAKASAGTDAVTLSFRFLMNPSQLGVVRIAVLNSQALELAGAIASAVAKSSKSG